LLVRGLLPAVEIQVCTACGNKFPHYSGIAKNDTCSKACADQKRDNRSHAKKTKRTQIVNTPYEVGRGPHDTVRGIIAEGRRQRAARMLAKMRCAEKLQQKKESPYRGAAGTG